MIPAKPISMEVCRYVGLVGTFLRSHAVTGSQLSAFVAYTNRRSWEVITSPINCASDDGDADYLRFRYSSGPDLVVLVDIGGCPITSNGLRTIYGQNGRRLAMWVGQPSSDMDS
jgi:hypothetical protein